MKKLISNGFILISMWGASAHAANNLPNLDGQFTIGSSTLFKSPKGVMWHLAADFTPELQCSPSANATNQTCVLSIRNAASAETRARMVELEKESGQSVISMTALDTAISSVRESFEGDAAQLLNPGFRFPQTLMMSGTVPYLRLFFRMKAGEGDAMMEKFMSSTGMGVFHSRFDLAGERLGDYVAIRSPQKLCAQLARLQGKIVSRAQALGELRASLSSAGLILNLIDEESALLNLSIQLQAVLFQPVRGGVRLKAEALSRFQNPTAEPLVITDQTSGALTAHCDASLELKSQASSRVTCSVEEQ